MSAETADKARIGVQCPGCATTLRIPQNLLTQKKVRCPKCGQQVSSENAGTGTGVRAAAAAAPKTKADPLLGTRVKHFELKSVLGRGAMGTVYEAEDMVLRRKVAVKILLPSIAAEGETALERFLSEARSAACLQHPNIVYIYQVGCEGNNAFIAMEMITGGSAADFLEEHGAMAARDATRVIIESARALAEAHSKGIIHRDVKPDNIMLGTNWMIKVTDFGLAKRLDSDAQLGVKGKALGTPGYMSPETCRGQDTDARSDIYSLGATYYCLLTGKAPFRGSDIRQILRRHLTEDCPDPRTERPDVPAGVIPVLRKAMERDVSKRYQNADEMIADLQAIDFSDAPAQEAESHEMQEWAELAATAQRAMSMSTAAVDEREMALPPAAAASRNPSSSANRLPVMPSRSPASPPASSGARPMVTAPATAAWTEVGGVKILARPIQLGPNGKPIRPGARQGGINPLVWVAAGIGVLLLLLLIWRPWKSSKPPEKKKEPEVQHRDDDSGRSTRPQPGEPFSDAPTIPTEK